MRLEFCVEGRLVSNNRVTRHVEGRALKSADARADQERVRSIAWAAGRLARWRVPAEAALTITAWNSRKDVGNIEKVLSDGIAQAGLLANDNDLIELHVYKKKDARGERHDVRLESR